MKFVILLLVSAVMAANAQVVDEKGFGLDFIVQNVVNPFLNDVIAGTADMVNQGLTNLISSIGKRGLGVDFVVQNVLNPFINDITTGTVDFVSQQLNSLVSGLFGAIGKRQSGLSMGLNFLMDNVVNPFIIEVATGTANLVVESVSNLMGGLVSAIGKRNVAAVSQLKGLVANVLAQAINMVKQLLPFLTTPLANHKFKELLNAFHAHFGQFMAVFAQQAAQVSSNAQAVVSAVHALLGKFQTVMQITIQAVINNIGRIDRA